MRTIIKQFVDNVNIPHYEGSQVRKVSDDELELFAQLIAGHCADIAIQAASDANFLTGISDADKRAFGIAAQIKQQFGVS